MISSAGTFLNASGVNQLLKISVDLFFYYTMVILYQNRRKLLIIAISGREEQGLLPLGSLVMYWLYIASGELLIWQCCVTQHFDGSGMEVGGEIEGWM